MFATVVAVALVAYLPGAVAFRLPWWQRDLRAGLAAEERIFWHLTLSLSWSLTVVLALAALNLYHFDTLLATNAGVTVALALTGGRRLAYGGRATRPGWTLVLPCLLIALGSSRFFPVSEYIIGGRDPGVYINEGIQIAQRGTLVIHDEAIAAVPDFGRDLFFPAAHNEDFYANAFMGFFIQDPATGRVVGQFPQLFPASIALGYGLHGLSGAREAVAFWGLLGVLAVYFVACRLFGPWVAFASAVLLSLHVIQVWFSRYPNADVVFQAGLFSALLAYARAHQDEDPFFGPIAAWLIGLQVFGRVDALLAIAALVGVVGLTWTIVPRARVRWSFLAPVAVMTAVGLVYQTTLMRAYFWRAAVFLENLPFLNVVAGLAAGVMALAVLWWGRQRYGDAPMRWFPIVVSAVAIILATYAYLWREPGGKLIAVDAYGLRDFVNIYLWWPMLMAALAGFALFARRDFWRDPGFALVFVAFSVFLLYKLRIVPEHFWQARRFMAIIFPGALVWATYALLGARPGSSGPRPANTRRLQWLRTAAGALVLVFVAQHYVTAAAPVLPHVEYRGIIPYLERLASRFTARDLIILESRDSGSDIHVLGPPLTYIYDKRVLVLHSAAPDHVMFRVFLEDALQRYDRVFFVGTGGTTLLSRQLVATPVDSDRVQVDEFEVTMDRLPTQVRHKEFDYGIYQLSVGQNDAGPFTLDVGERDDLNVVRFHAKERSDERSIRWTQDSSQVAVTGMTGDETEVILVMADGGRPVAAIPARVRVLLNGVALGETPVGPDFRSYRFAIPARVADAAAQTDEPAMLRLESTVWSPGEALGTGDTRQLGVMLDTVTVR